MKDKYVPHWKITKTDRTVSYLTDMLFMNIARDPNLTIL